MLLLLSERGCSGLSAWSCGEAKGDGKRVSESFSTDDRGDMKGDAEPEEPTDVGADVSLAESS